jgi:hypothetical protein
MPQWFECNPLHGASATATPFVLRVAGAELSRDVSREIGGIGGERVY